MTGILGRAGELGLLPATMAQLEQLNGGPVEEADHDTRILLVSTATNLTAADLAGYPNLAHLALCGTSFGRIDTAVLDERGVTTSYVVDYGDHPAAEVVFMQLVGLARGYGPYQWRAESHELAGKTLTIVGLGALGAAMARLGLAYRMQVNHLSRSPKPEWEAQGVRQIQHEELAGTDVVILTSPTNVVVLDQADFDRLDGAIVVQASLGQVVDDAAFRAWIAREQNHAVFDLSAGEDIYAAYASLPRVIFPRVVAADSVETMQRLGDRVVANVTEALALLRRP